MSQITYFAPAGVPGSGTVTSVSGGNNITITGNPTINPTVNVSGTTNHSVLLGNSTASINSLANGTTGQILTAVTGADPQWANASGGDITITGDTGGALGPSASFTFAGGTTGLSFDGASTTLTTSFAGITANGGDVNLATDNGSQAVNIATGGSNNPIVIGNQGGGTQLNINSGSNGISIETTGALNLCESTSNNAIVIGNSGGGTQFNIHSGSNGFALDTPGPVSICYDATDGGLNLGTGASAGRPIQLGNQIGTTSILIQAGTNGVVIDPTGGINIGASGFDGGINLGTGATSGRALQVGNQIGTTSVSIAAGTNGCVIEPVGGMNICNSAFDGSVNIATGATSGRTITIGNTTGTTSLTLNNGSGGTLMPQVFGATTGVSGLPVVIDNTGLLGTVVSSKRYKDNIIDMRNSTSNIMKLRPVNFTLKNDESKTRQWGLIAEEVAQVYPELVSYNRKGEAESVRYNDLPAMLLNEVQKLRNEIDLLKSKVN